MTYQIRQASPADAPVIAEFNDRIARETESRSLDPAIIRPGVSNMLADPKKGHYWVAEQAGVVVGQIMVTYEWSDWRNGTMWWIQSVYVHPDHRRCGVFSALYRHVESLAKQTPQVCGLRLYVEEGNTRAQATYEALGMHRPGYVVMQTVFSDTGE
jgi:ribosomal protein S18 acetylase RimI-like enzyme